jgi:hypothetical protein
MVSVPNPVKDTKEKPERNLLEVQGEIEAA